MSILRRLTLCCLVAVLTVSVVLVGGGRTASAQDDAPVVCDSTLAILLLVAEHDYDYLSTMMMDEEMMASMPHFDLGQYQGVTDEIVAMMTEMMEEGDTMEEGMTEEEMAAHDEMLSGMMGMEDSAAMIAAYMSEMGMEMGDSMTVLTPGNVAGENPACAQVRSDVEKFLLAHILTESSMNMMDE